MTAFFFAYQKTSPSQDDPFNSKITRFQTSFLGTALASFKGMKTGTMLKTTLLGLLLVASSYQAQAICSIPVRSKSYEKYQQGTYYDILSVSRAALADLSTSSQFNYLAHYQKKVSERTKTDFAYLLQRQKPFFKNFPADSERFDKALSKKIGRVRSASCLENFLLDNHLRTFSSETEFSAYVLTKFDSEAALVIVYTQITNGTVSNSPITGLVNGYRKQGWNIESHIHNHPFSFKNPHGDIAGTAIPSAADVATFKELGQDHQLRSGVITNGFHSYIVYRNEFERL